MSYSNCQGSGVVHFLRRSRLAESFEFVHYNNYQLILGEQSSADLFRDAALADVFFYQPLPAIQYCDLSTEQMIESVIPSSALKLAFGDAFNHGFFPLAHHGQWQTGAEVKAAARVHGLGLLELYDMDAFHFDCMGRFLTCLLEQTRREALRRCDIVMADFIAANFRRVQLFLSENHPASAYFAELARRVIERVTGEPAEPLSYSTPNDANLPCGLLVHPAVVRELGLEYLPEPGAEKFFRDYLERLIAESSPAVTATNT